MRLVWRGPQCRKAIWSLCAKNLKDAIAMFLKELRIVIGFQGPPRSSPNRPPHIDGGELIKSYETDVDTQNLGARIGTDCPYAEFLELGTPGMAPRPHLRRTALVLGKYIAQIMGRS